MNPWLTTRRFVMIVVFTAAWCGLWRDLSFANVASGVLLTTLILALGLGTDGQGGVNFGALVRLSWLVIVDLVQSTKSVAYEVLTPTDYTEESVIAVNVPESTRNHLLLLTVAITLTPGTAVVDADPETCTLYLHVLHHDRTVETVAHVEQLARLAREALPVNGVDA